MQKIYRRLRARTRFPIPVIFLFIYQNILRSFLHIDSRLMVLPKWRWTGNDLQVLRRIPLHFFCCCLYECIEMTSKPSTAISSSGAENGDRFRTPFFLEIAVFVRYFPKLAERQTVVVRLENSINFTTIQPLFSSKQFGGI